MTDAALVHFFDEWEQTIPQDARAALAPIVAAARATLTRESCPICAHGELIPLKMHVCDSCRTEVGTAEDATANVQAMLWEEKP